MFGFPHCVTVLCGTFDYDPVTMLQASLFVVLFNTAYLVARIITSGGKNQNTLNFREQSEDNQQTLRSTRSLHLVTILCICIFASLFIRVVFAVLFFGGLEATSWAAFYALPHSPYDFNMISILLGVSDTLLLAAGGIVLTFWISRKYFSSIACMLAILGYAIITRNRVTILPVLVSIILLYISKNKKIGIKQVLSLAILAICIVYTVDGLRVFRHYGTVAQFREMFDFRDFNRRVWQMITTGEGELGLRNIFYYFLEHDNRFPQFGEARTYVRLLLMPLPSKYSFGLKPPDFAVSMGSAYIGDFSNTMISVHPTLYGDCYANLGWFGILLAIFWAVFAFTIDKIADRKNLVLKSVLLVVFGCMYVIIGRGSVYNGCYMGFVSAIFLFVAAAVVP